MMGNDSLESLEEEGDEVTVDKTAPPDKASNSSTKPRAVTCVLLRSRCVNVSVDIK